MSKRHTREPGRGKLIVWLLLSIVFHALALLLIEQPESPYAGTPTLRVVIEEHRLPPSTLSVQTAATPSPLPQQTDPRKVKEPVIKRVHVTREVPSPSPQQQATVTPADNHPLIAESTTTEATVSPASRDIAQEREVITLRLRQALARHFIYPLQARRRGWQGEVILAFTLERNGQILNIHIARSSGHRALDRAAVASLNKVGRIERATQRALNLELPVIYRLQEG